MNVLSTCIGIKQLDAFSLGNLGDAEALAIEDHLAHCSLCVAALQQTSNSDTLLDAFRAQTIVASPLVNAEQVQQIIHKARQLYSAVTPGAISNAEERKPVYDVGHLRQLDEFRLVKVLGQGGMGVVFQAEDLRLRRMVAVKALLPKHVESAASRERFLREARSVAGLEHDNIVPIHYVGEDQGVPYFVMPLLAGEALETKCQRDGILKLDEIYRIGIAVAEGLAASHRRGIVHRDVKLGNVWLEKVDNGQETTGSPFRVKLLDFGLAHHVQHDIHLTQEGMLIGTPAYMSPEQANGQPVDARSDLFSLGTVLYVMASGKLPFVASNSMSTLRAIAETTATPLAEVDPSLPPALIALIQKLHAKDPAQRFALAADVARELRRISENGVSTARIVHSVRWPRRRPFLLAGSLLMVLIGLGICEAAGITRVTRAFQDKEDAGARPELVGIAPASEALANQPLAADEKVPVVFPVALLGFEERGAKDTAAKVADLLFAKLANNPGLYLVDRADLKKVLAEAELNISGAVKSGEATQLGQLTGAKLLLTGSVNQIDKKIILVAKVIGTETSHVTGVSVEGKANDDLSDLVSQLADKLGEIIAKKANELVAKPAEKKDRLAALEKRLMKGARPTVFIQIGERHVGLPTIDPAAQTELAYFCTGTGFTVIDDEEGAKSKADFFITGEGISETATRHGNLVSVKARVEVKVVDRKTGQVIAVDRQTVVVVDLTEQVAGKSALQEAAAQIAERMLPKLVKP